MLVLEQKTDLNSLGRDLSLVRDALDDRLDKVIASYGDNALGAVFFLKQHRQVGLHQHCGRNSKAEIKA